MSAELFHVIAAIIRRLTRHSRKIPLLSRYDQHEKTWSAPMPFLFQRQRGGTRAVISPQRVLRLLSRRCEALAEQHVGFHGLVFTPHDFRRLFATELVNSGLPIHIGAALLGHLNLQTTRGYVTVFNEDVVRHYQEFLLRRRTLRPQEEYRAATGEEWDEFEEHFDKRKVELGSCGRPYGTPCAHEHACIRCPMLQISPKMIPRLDEIEIDLQQRRERAEREGWRGEIEGIDLTMSFLQAKRIEGLRSQRLGQHVDLGLPSPAAARRD
ncbi:site-specific integrase [Streptomyces sp. NPDC046862]|uniref:site-specific integrase n=1 Tax=Streptomyces sp. NPDC046862 TaxID=3154603 RepID=UPI0034529824